MAVFRFIHFDVEFFPLNLKERSMIPLRALRKAKWRLTEENYDSSFLRFHDRQAGVSLVYDPHEGRYYYNAYCAEAKILKQLFSVEYVFLEQALETINDEFGTWELVSFDPKKSGCGSCVAKSVAKSVAKK